MPGFPIVLLLCTLLVTGCGHVISQAERTAARELPVGELLREPAAHDGEIVLLGGVIATCVGDEQRATLEIIPWRLDRWGEPVAVDAPWQRLAIASTAPLDPQLYASGRLITLTAQVVVETPFFLLREAYLWPGNRRYPVRPTTEPYRSDSVPRWYDRTNPYDPELPDEEAHRQPAPGTPP